MPETRRGNVKYLPTVEWRETILPAWATAQDQFVLTEVCGESLTPIGINDGDYVLVYLTKNVSEGDLVAANTPVGFLVKFLSYLPNGDVCLSGADTKECRCFPPEDVTIEGKVIHKT